MNPRPGRFAFAVLALLLRAASPASAADSPAPRHVADDRLAALEANPADRSGDTLLELALAYDERQQPARAADCYRLAAAAGIGVAELRLGALCETGAGVAQSYAEARAHYERALALGAPEANLRLGLLYLEGWGVPADATAAVAHIRQAAEAGYLPAQRILSDMYFAGVKVPRDLKQALAWAERSAASHDPEGQADVGAIRQAASRLPQDLRLAREWYQLSAEQDYTRGMLGMASTFLKTGADPESVRIGLRWLDLAAEGGNNGAAFYRAAVYLSGRDGPVTPDIIARARTLIEQAARGGEAVASEVLELENSGRALPAALAYVLTVPYDDRYVQRLARDPMPAVNGNVPPRPLKIVRPIYPSALLLAQTEGDVMVEFVVDTTGRVRDAHVVSSTHPGFAEHAAEAVLAWRFVPGMHAGHAVNTRTRVPVQFRFSEIPQPGSKRPGSAAPQQSPAASR